METCDGIEGPEVGSGIVPTAALDEGIPIASMLPSSSSEESGGFERRGAGFERRPPETLDSP